MQLGSPQRPDLSKVTNQEEINEKIVFSMNENSKQLYNALKNNLSFYDNIQGRLIEEFEIRHGESTTIPHRLGYNANNLLILNGNHVAKGIILSSSRNSSIGQFYLPSSTIIDSSGTSIYVSDPNGFKVGDLVQVGTQQLTIQTINSNHFVLSEAFSGTNLRTTIYVISSKLTIFIF